MAGDGPTVRRRRLGLELKKAREAAKLTQETVSAHFEWNSAKLTRMETGRVSVTARDVKDLLILYGVTDQDYIRAMQDVARKSKQRSWWTDYKDILRSNYVGLEADAASVREWEPIIVPGLLQTEGYMRTLMRASGPIRSIQDLDRRVELRLKRQERLIDTTDPLYLSAILDESVLRRRVGGPEVMREQLSHLIKGAKLPNVNLQVLPPDAGEHALLGGAAILVEFPDADELDVVFLEGIAGEYCEGDPAEVARYRRIFERLSATARNRRDTLKAITDALGELG